MILTVLAGLSLGLFAQNSTAEKYYNSGLTKQDNDDCEGAIKDFTNAILYDDEVSSYWFERAYCKRVVGDDYGSISDYTRAIALNSSDMAAYFNRGLSYYDTEQWAEAEVDFKKVANNDKTDWEAWYYVGFAQFEQGEYEDAVESYSNALDYNPDDAPSWFNRGLSYFELYEDDKACADWAIADKKGSTKAEGMLDEYCDGGSSTSGGSSDSKFNWDNDGGDDEEYTESDYCNGLKYIVKKGEAGDMLDLAGDDITSDDDLGSTYAVDYELDGFMNLNIYDFIGIIWYEAETIDYPAFKSGGNQLFDKYVEWTDGCLGSGYSSEWDEASDNVLSSISYTKKGKSLSVVNLELVEDWDYGYSSGDELTGYYVRVVVYDEGFDWGLDE